MPCQKAASQYQHSLPDGNLTGSVSFISSQVKHKRLTVPAIFQLLNQSCPSTASWRNKIPAFWKFTPDIVSLKITINRIIRRHHIYHRYITFRDKISARDIKAIYQRYQPKRIAPPVHNIKSLIFPPPDPFMTGEEILVSFQISPILHLSNCKPIISKTILPFSRQPPYTDPIRLLGLFLSYL